jgi:hypothetical protein
VKDERTRDRDATRTPPITHSGMADPEEPCQLYHAAGRGDDFAYGQCQEKLELPTLQVKQKFVARTGSNELLSHAQWVIAL